MKDATQMKGQVLGHLGEDIKINSKIEGVLYPGFILFAIGERPQIGYELDFFVDRDSGLNIVLSEGEGFTKPLEFDLLQQKFSILAQKTEEPDKIIINLKQIS